MGLLFSRLSFPMLVVLGGGVVILLVTPFLKKNTSSFPIGLGALVIVLALVFSWREWISGATMTLAMFLFDRVAFSLDLIFLLATLLTIFLSKDYLSEEKIREGEYYTLILFTLFGAMVIVHGADLIVLFLGLEILSLASYILTGLKRGTVRSYEAALKYFVLGSFASSFLLFGIAMLYGTAGSTSFAALQKLSIPPAEPILVSLGIALLLIGVSFKVGAVPFHFWSPDVYEGAPTSVTAFMASVVKAAGFAALIRIAIILGHLPQIPWVQVLWGLSAVTMTVGNLSAIRQTNIKRMLAYSSIAHAGYALVGLTTTLKNNLLSESALASVLFYLFAYSLMTIGAFAVVIALGKKGDAAEEMSDFSGLAERHPALAGAMALFLLSLTGIPPTIGFMGKFYLFSGAIEAGFYGLVVVGVLNSAVSAYYYLGPVIKMYFQKEIGYDLPLISYTLLTGIFLCLFVVLYLGIFPSNLFLMARESVKELVF